MAPDDPIQQIMLLKPEAGTTDTVSMLGGGCYVLSFNYESVTFESHGDDVGITFDDGSRLVLQSFYSVAQASDFYLQLSDGLMISGKDMGEALLPTDDEFQTGAMAFADASALDVDAEPRNDDDPAYGYSRSPESDVGDMLQADLGERAQPYASPAESPRLPEWPPADEQHTNGLIDDDPLELVLTPSMRPPLCDSFCDISQMPGSPEPMDNELDPLRITPRSLPHLALDVPVVEQSIEIVQGNKPGPLLLLLQSDESGEILLLEDLLDLTAFGPTLDMETGSMFESLFTPSLDAASTSCENVADVGYSGFTEEVPTGSDELMLSFLRLGTL